MEKLEIRNWKLDGGRYRWCVAVAIAVVVGIRSVSGMGSRSLGPNFQYDPGAARKVKPEQVLYKELAPIRLPFKKPQGMAVGKDDSIIVTGDSTLLYLDKQGQQLAKKDLKAPAGCVAVDKDGTVYVGMRDHLEVYDASGARKQLIQRMGRASATSSDARTIRLREKVVLRLHVVRASRSIIHILQEGIGAARPLVPGAAHATGDGEPQLARVGQGFVEESIRHGMVDVGQRPCRRGSHR